MWPFTRRRKRVEERAAWFPGRGPDGFGGDAFWSWGSVAGGEGVTPAVAESVAAVGAAVGSIASVLASLPAEVTLADDSRAVVPTHDLARLIRDGVNENESWQDLLESLLASALMRGNGGAIVDTDARGRLTGLTTMPWDAVTVRVTDDGRLLFDYRPPWPPGAGKVRTYAREDILWIKDRSDSGLVGVSRLQRAAASMSYAVSIQNAAQTFSQNASRPGGTLNAPGKVSEATANRLANEWDENYGGSRRGKMAVLPEGLKFEPLGTMTAEDVQLIQARQWSVGDIARIFGVSPWVLGDSSRMTFASAREATRSHATLSLSPWASKVERAFSASVLSPQYRLRIDLGSLQRADTETLYAALLKARQGGWISPNDAREESGWPRVAGADSLDPPVSGGQPAGDTPTDPAPAPAPADDGTDANKIADLAARRARHGSDD